MERLRKRADFLAAARGKSASTRGFILQSRNRGDGGPIRVGFTVSGKVGTAVERNRVRRRLREIAKISATAELDPGHDYVLIGRRTALSLPFEQLNEDLKGAVLRLRAFG